MESVPAIKGRLGSTNYYICCMKAKNFIANVKVPKEIPGWDSLSLQERSQREINYNRVREHLGPYIAEDPDRFFGSFIVSFQNTGESELKFDPISPLMNSVPGQPSTIFDKVGLLGWSGGTMFPLDGQHRLKALEFAIYGIDEKSKPLPYQNPEVSDEDVTVIIVEHDIKKARKIFNKVNRYAKPTSLTDNLATSDDDIVAVLSRDIVQELIGNDLVSSAAGNTLSDSSPHFTTTGTVYKISKAVLEDKHNKIDTTRLPEKSMIDTFKSELLEFWGHYLKIDNYKKAIFHKTDMGDGTRAGLRYDHVNCKPIIQRALAEAIIRLRIVDPNQGRPNFDEIIDRVNSLNWKNSHKLWEKTLLLPGGKNDKETGKDRGKIITGESSKLFATRYIAYLLGEKLSDFELNDLTAKYQASIYDTEAELPEPKF